MTMDNTSQTYDPVLALTVISGIFLAIGAICAIIVTVDIILRRGWRSMMGIMIPVYIINATYLGPFAIYIYYRFGRPSKPTLTQSAPEKVTKDIEAQSDTPSTLSSSCAGHQTANSHHCHDSEKSHTTPPVADSGTASHCCKSKTPVDAQSDSPLGSEECSTIRQKESHSHCHAPIESHGPKPAAEGGPDDGCCKPKSAIPPQTTPTAMDHGAADEAHCCHADPTRPFWATVTAGVFHCGAGCVLGDLVGEWLVFGTDARINGANVWPCLLIDYAFALLFGVLFQYFSIAPMSGVWGPITVWRAVKADVASLTSFQIGLFGWMVAYQVGIFDYMLMTNTWTYWWLMQVGMIVGFFTAWPANWFLIKMKVKEPCC